VIIEEQIHGLINLATSQLFLLYELLDDFILIFISPTCNNSDISESFGTLKALEEKWKPTRFR
jgi:hypothetical protein